MLLLLLHCLFRPSSSQTLQPPSQVRIVSVCTVQCQNLFLAAIVIDENTRKATANCGSQWNNSMLSMLQSQLVMTLLHSHFLFGNFSFSLWLLQRNRIQEQLSTATTIYDRPLNKHSNGSPNFDVRNIHQEPISPLKLIINRSMTITLPLD